MKVSKKKACFLLLNKRQILKNFEHFKNHDLFFSFKEKTFDIVAKLCQDVFHTTPSIILGDLFPYLIALWIDNDHHLTKFPAKLTQCGTHNDFLIKYMDTITLRILLYKPECLPELLKMTESSSLSDLLTLVR